VKTNTELIAARAFARSVEWLAPRAIRPRIARRRAEEEEGNTISSPSDDEVDGLESAIRSERSEQSDPESRAAVLRRRKGTRISSPSDDEVGGLQSAIRSERSEQSDRA
jgi:hypothetical protein